MPALVFGHPPGELMPCAEYGFSYDTDPDVPTLLTTWVTETATILQTGGDLRTRRSPDV